MYKKMISSSVDNILCDYSCFLAVEENIKACRLKAWGSKGSEISLL
ncbi:MAG: hypothetical protein ACREV6_16310 [Clostridium sp.]